MYINLKRNSDLTLLDVFSGNKLRILSFSSNLWYRALTGNKHYDHWNCYSRYAEL